MADKAPPSRCRRWQVTINNPADKGLTHDAISDIMAHGQATVYWCMCDEEGDECQTRHTHLYVVYEHQMRFSTLRKLFQNSHLEPVRGTSEENRAYVLKDGEKYHKDETGHYCYKDSSRNVHEGINFSDTFEEFGELPHEHQGQRGDLNKLYTMIEDGLEDYEILAENPSYMNRLEAIQRTRQILIEKDFREVYRKIEVTYIYGAARTGKTRSVMDKYGYSNVCRITDYKHPFDLYRAQDVILFDEFRSSIKVSEMLPYLEGYPIELPCRYANKQACYTKVYIISNEPLENQFPNIQELMPSSWDAFLSRINTVRVFREDGTTRDFSVDEYFNAVAHDHANPVYDDVGDVPF